MRCKNISDFFGHKNRDKSKCLNIIDQDFIAETVANISPAKISDVEKISLEKRQIQNKTLLYIVHI